MGEREFWTYLGGMLDKGRLDMACAIDAGGRTVLNEAEMFLAGHVYLPEGYERIPCNDIVRIGQLLFSPQVQLRTKQAVLILLAHHPSREALAILERFNAFPDMRLRIFGEMALDECRMWNEA